MRQQPEKPDKGNPNTCTRTWDQQKQLDNMLGSLCCVCSSHLHLGVVLGFTL
jgi:hypothetical protein